MWATRASASISPESEIDPTRPENLDREDGRGLYLMRKLMDRVEMVEVPRGSVVRMTLNRE